jgi:hypothetical protein
MAILLRSHGDAQLEAQRFQASQAARPAVTQAQRAQDVFSQMRAAMDVGEMDTARALALELRPLLGFMPEGN